AGPRRSAPSRRIAMASTTWPATSGSGPPTSSSRHARRPRPAALPGPPTRRSPSPALRSRGGRSKAARTSAPRTTASATARLRARARRSTLRRSTSDSAASSTEKEMSPQDLLVVADLPPPIRAIYGDETVRRLQGAHPRVRVEIAETPEQLAVRLPEADGVFLGGA